jgi:hypothetical protein
MAHTTQQLQRTRFHTLDDKESGRGMEGGGVSESGRLDSSLFVVTDKGWSSSLRDRLLDAPKEGRVSI